MVDSLSVPSLENNQPKTAFVLRTPASIKSPTVRQALSVALISIALIIPCLWHPRIEAGDLASHTYNAWLTILVKQGRAPGLWIASQHNNVLFDNLLLRLCSMFGFVAGEKIATAIAVLIFFWSAFTLSSVINKRATWFLVPVLAMLSYGWTLEMGFLNFYLSLALSFAGLAIVWASNGVRLLYALLLVPLIWMAHPLGLAWFAACAAFILLGKRLPERMLWVAGLAGLAALFVCRSFVAAQYQVTSNPQWYLLNGTDQLVLGSRYRFLPYVLLGAVVVCVLVDRLRNTEQQSTPAEHNWFAIQLWLAVLLGVMILPEGLILPQYAAPVMFITSRFALAAAVIGCCALGPLKPLSRTLFTLLSGGIALTFFGFLYVDTGHVYAMEREAQSLLTHVPREGRVISTLFPLHGSRVMSHHVVARACIGHCFVIDNYEAATKQFRLRANPGNQVVAADAIDTDQMLMGTYVVKPEDLPAWHIFQCGPADIDLCLRPLKAGPLNGISSPK